MDPNQTTGTTPSGVNDIDPIGPDSGAGVTPTGLTGANDATKTADPMQRIPPIGTSSQDRSLPINKTSIPERAGARVWNRPGDRSSSDDLNRSQSRPISPTPLAQTRGELIKLRGMMKTQIDEIRTPDCSALQRSQAQYLDATREKIHSDPRRRAGGAKDTNLTTKPFYPRESNSIRDENLPSSGFDNPTEQARRHDLCGPVNIDPQRVDLAIPSETGTFQNYIERNDAELKRIHAIVHMATCSAPDIDMVIEETRRTTFTNRIASAKISHPNEVVALAALKNGVWFSSKFREELAVRTPISLDDALHRAFYFATHEEEVAALKEQYSANKNNATKKPATPKEPTTKGQHSYAINNSPQKSSTYDLSKYCAFHDRKGHSSEESREEEEEPMTPKSNQKAKVPTNKRGREIEQEPPSSPPPAPKKRVDMISWGQNSNTTDEIKSQTEGKLRCEISVEIRTLENPDEVTPPPPRVTPYNPNTKPPYVKISNFKRKNKITKIRELFEKKLQRKDVI
ncbi:hypothetical protein Bca52824_061030 [Brassica carinata]|uniref:Uncharacterized protein n=1 Tax=Brassica carinata TaxID=52824 RepID=A0A8X7UG50_BRACI|nr:hypothetical protein Bca52824_061030 [Brassica carinata]